MDNDRIEEKAVLFEDDRVLIERIRSHGWAQPQDECFVSDTDEFVTLERGTAILTIIGSDDREDTIALNEGGCYLIASGTRHRVARTDADTVWLTVYIK